MAKFFGLVGFASVEETSPGIWQEVIVEKPYYGDVLRDSRRLEEGASLNDDIRLGNSFSLMADAYAYLNFFALRYVKWAGTRWKVSNVEVRRPRLILTIGGIYNGPAGETPADA